MKRLLSLLVLFALVGLVPRVARAETEWVMILDNSGSMSVGSTTLDSKGVKIRDNPPADPHRVAVIATLIFRAFLDPGDKLTILTFQCCDPYPPPAGTPMQKKVGLFRVLPNTITDIRTLVFNEITPFTGPMKEARRILEASQAPKKILLLVTDGAPTLDDPLTANDAKKLLGLDQPAHNYDVISLAIAPDAQTDKDQKDFLGPLGKLEQIQNPTEFVSAFTRVYADSIRSRPDSGTLQPGATYTFKAPKYVSEVLVAMATVNRTGTFTAALDAGGRPVTAVDGGDSGCAPDKAPCHAYQVFKAPKSVDADETWTLSIPASTRGPVAYGVILRYDLGAEIISMSEAKAGEEKEVIARLTFKGAGFNDKAFFAADGFEAHAVLGDTEVPLTLRPDDGSWVGKIKVAKAGMQPMTVRFRNKWLTVSNLKMFEAGEWIPLTLNVAPNPIDLGTWTGARGKSERCVTLDFSKSVNADKVPIEIFAKNLPAGLSLSAPKGLIKGPTQVCVVAPGCCDAYASGTASIVIRGEHAHYHPEAIELPLRFAIEPTPFLTCWWRVIAGILGTIMALIIIWGFIKPFDFDAQEVIKLSGKEATLARASGRRLRELPGGKRGFYRDARVAFDGGGGAVKPGAGAVLIFKATKSDAVVVSKTTIEHKDPRTRKWAPIDASSGAIYLRRAVVYRVGEIYFQLG